MSTRWMTVQYVGDTLRLPIVDEFSMDKPFGSSELEREVRRIVVNPLSDSPQTFVPESENAKLRECIHKLEMEGSDHLYRTAYAEDANRTLESENEKLRDLALNCYRMAKQLGTKCKRYCSHWPDCCENDSLEHCEPCSLTVLARELGIDMC